MEIDKDVEDEDDAQLHTWATKDQVGQLHFSQRGDTIHIDFLGNEDEMDGTPGVHSNALALIRELLRPSATTPRNNNDNGQCIQ